jgi:ribonuclease E
MVPEAPQQRESEAGDEQRRERRSRDRFGRDRRERGPRDEATAASNEGAAVPDMPGESAMPQPAVAPEPAAASTAAAPARPREMPKVAPYSLPVDDLMHVAEGSGLQWVNSDAGKVAAVQAAIAAEPRLAHVPRERPPLIVIDEGPLVLVETKRDLRGMQLPFEQEQGQLPLQ